MIRVVFFLFIFLIIITSCIKDQFEVNPSITFIIQPGYTYKDTTIKINDFIKTGIVARSVGKGNRIKKIEILKSDTIHFDTLIGREKVSFDFFISHNLPDSIDWTFIVYDEGLNSSRKVLKTIVDKLPVLKFITDSGFTYKNTQLKHNDSAKIGFYGKAIGDTNEIKLFVIKKQDSVYFSDMVNAKEFLNSPLYIVQDSTNKINWKFGIYDKDNDSTYISFSTTLIK